MRNAILRGMTHAGNPHVVPTSGFGAASRFDEGRTASAKPRRGALLCKKAVLWLVAAVLPAFAAAAVPSVEQSSTTVDILVAFDRNAAAYANRNGGVADFALTAVSKMNTALANSGLDTDFRFRFVGTMEVDAEATDVHSALESIRDSETGWAEIRKKRNEVGADIVTTLIDTGSAYGTTGASWPLTTTELASFVDSAYNVCAIRAVEIGHAMTREVGHNMGAGNATEVADPDIRGPQLYGYSSGYYFTATNGTRYHTIMADSADGYGNTYALAPLFSTPLAKWDGAPVGDATHDNTRTLRATFAAVSLWSAQKIPLSYDVFFSSELETFFDTSVTVTLTPGKAGLAIRYTTDGSDPTLTSHIYSTPLKLTRTTTVKAAAVYDGRLGPVYTAHYLKRDLATALNAPQLEWTTSPDDPWVAQSDDAFDGFAAKSCPKFVGNFGCGKTSWLKTTVTGPTEMGFRYQKTQYSSAFKVYCDDQVVWSDSENEAGIGGAGWHQAVVNLPEGTHEITFAFEQGYGSYNGFNGIVLDTVCFDTWSVSPTISPATSDDQATATVFTGSMTITLTPPAGRTGTLFYTLDGSDPTQEGALPYTGPFTVDKSVFVQAVFVEPGRDASASARGYFLERHPMKPGEWTTDVEGVKEASARDGRLVAVLMAHRADCDWTKKFMPVAESPEFLTWAEMNGVYLITADDSERVDTEAAKNYFRELYSGQDAIFPTLVFADPSNPDVPLASGVARNDGITTIGGVPYDDTVESLVRGFAAVMGETFVPAAPTASPEPELVAGFPVTVTLENPNGYGVIYYTLDGSAPTLEKGTRYAGPIKIVDKKAVLCAAVRLDSGLSGLVLIKSYKTGSDVVWTTLPTGMTGYGYVVSNLTAGAEIRPDNEGGYALPIGAKVGIYAVAEAGYVIVGTNPYVIDEVTADTAIDASALPTAQPPCVVTIGDHPHLTVAWTSGDGAVTNAVDGTDFSVAKGATNVKVFFMAESGWEIVGDAVVELGTVTENITFGPESGFLVPTVRHEPVSYIDADGEEKEKSGDGLVVVTSETRFLTDGWYVVLDDIDIAAKTNIVVEGDVHLILCDGASLTVTNAAAWTAAVAVEDGASLSIFGQANGTGRLTAKGGNRAAGIGCAHQKDCGTISIHGGIVTATGGSYGAGIGSSSSCSNGCVVITGGRIAAAKGNSQGSDIGNGGGKTTGCAVSISGGLFANLVDVSWCAEGYAPVANPDPNTAADYPYTVRPAYRVTVGEHPNVTVAWTCGDKSVTNEIEGFSFGVMPPGTNGVQVIFTADPGWVLVGDAVVDVGEVAGDIAFGDGNDFRVPGVQREPVAYVDVDGEERSKAGDEFEVVTSETRFLASGWYVVLDDVEIWAKTNLTVVGDAHLILCDGASLTVANAQSDTAGIAVGGGASLAIYGQAEDTGRLDVTGGVRASGIGGVMDGDCGAIAIHGGTIVANGGFSGAGIGSGPRGSGGSVSITGGRIRATAGSDFAPDIGSGSDAVTNCAVSISGGVFARELQDAWLAPGFAAVANTDAATKDEYPWALAHPVFVTVTLGDHPHLTVAWTGGDGSVTNAVDGTSFEVSNGTENVKVIFTAEPGWEIVGDAVVNLGTVTEDTVFGDGNDYRAPEVRDVCVWCGIDGEAWYFRGGVPLWRIEAAYNEGVMSLRQRNASASGTLDLWGIERALADVGIGPVSNATLTFESTWGTNGFANVTELIITNRHFAANYPVGSLQPFAGISRLVLGDGETDLTVGSRDVSDPVVTASCSVFGTNFDTLESVEIWGRDVRLRNAFCCYAANATARLADVRVHATGDLDLGWNSFNVSTGSKGGTISNAVFEAGGDLDLGGRALRYSLVSNALVSVSAPPGARVVLGGPHFIGQYNKKMPVTLDWYAPPPVVEDPSALCDSTITWRFPVERAEEYAGIFQGREKFVTISDPGCRLSVALPPSESADSTADRRDKYGSWQQLKTAGTSADSDGGGTAYWHRFLRIEPGASPTLRPGSGQASFTFVAENTGEMDAALRSVRIESPDIDIISDEDYARYFFVRTEPLGNNRYQLTAVLDPGAVEVESVVKRLAAQLPCETASLAGSPGLWYFVEQAERLEDLGKSFSKPVQANCDGTFSLELAPFKDSAFYRLHVKASESESSADR